MTSPTNDDLDLVNITPPTKPKALAAHVDEKIATPELGGAMDDAARKVRERADYLQQNVISPLATKTRSFAESNPVLFTFLAIFSVLSFIPIACFVGFVVTFSTLIIGGALIFIVLSMLSTILFGACILLPVLLISLTFTLLTLGALLSAFLSHKLYLSIRSHPDSVSDGVKAFVDETKARVVGAGWGEGEGWIKLGKEVQHVRVDDGAVAVLGAKADEEGEETETERKHTVKRE